MILKNFFFPIKSLLILVCDTVTVAIFICLGLITLYKHIPPRYVIFTMGGVFLWVIALYIVEGYNRKFFQDSKSIILVLIKAGSLFTAGALIFGFYTLYKGEIKFGQSFLTFILLPLAGIYFERYLIIPFLLRSKSLQQKVLVADRDPISHKIIDYINRKEDLDLELFDPKLGKNLNNHKALPIIASTKRAPSEEWSEVLEFCKNHDIKYLILSDKKFQSLRNEKPLSRKNSVFSASKFYQILIKKFPIVKTKDGWQVGSFKKKNRTSVFASIERIFNFFVASIFLTLTLPITVLVAIGIKLDSKGSVFFVQERVGKDETTFNLIKFRTMIENAENELETRWPEKMDENVITKFGTFLRKYNLDEIPQFINVLKGEVNIFGPRPERVSVYEEHKNQIPYYHMRTRIKPGITGWTTVKKPNIDTKTNAVEKLEYDLFYQQNRSFILNVLIILRTMRLNLITGR